MEDSRRSPALDRVLGIMPPLLAIESPDGYGKTTMALAYAGVFKTHASIDLTGVQTARELLFALLKTLPFKDGDDAYRRQAQLSLAADETVPPQLVQRVLEIWRDPGAPAAVVFDNAEHLSPDVLWLFGEILEHRPSHRVCIVCSETPLKLTAVASGAGMLVGESDLVFSAEETRALFAENPPSPEHLRRVVDLTQGRPITAALLRWLHATGKLEPALSHAEQHEHPAKRYAAVLQQALESLTELQRRVVDFCSVVPNVCIADVRTCLGSLHAEELSTSLRSFPLLRMQDDRVEVHSLLRAAIAAENKRAADDLRAAARAAMRRGDRDAAAARYVACGDRDEARKVLDDLLEHGTTADVATVATVIDRTTLERHPRWFVIVTVLRRYDITPAENLASIRSRRVQIEQTGDPAARFTVGTLELHQLLHSGLHEEARTRLQELENLVASLKRSGGVVNALRAHVAARFVDVLAGVIAVAEGEFSSGERLLKRARFTLGQFPMITLIAASDGWLPIGLQRADIQLIRQQCARARETLNRTGLDVVLLDLDVNEAFAGWALGDDAMYEESIERVDSRAQAYRLHGFDHLLACAGRRDACEPLGIEPLRRSVISHLLAAGRMGPQRLSHAQNALRLARELRHALFITLSAIAVRERGGDAACEPDELLTLSAQLESAFRSRMRDRD